MIASVATTEALASQRSASLDAFLSGLADVSDVFIMFMFYLQR